MIKVDKNIVVTIDGVDVMMLRNVCEIARLKLHDAQYEPSTIQDRFNRCQIKNWIHDIFKEI